MSWFGFKPNKPIEKEVQYKDIDNDETETEHFIESENIETFHDEEVDSDEGSETE